MTHIKPLRPSLRERKRYVVFEVISRSGVRDVKAICKAIRAAFLEFAGRIGRAAASLHVMDKEFNEEKQRGIIRINHCFVDHLRASTTFIRKIGRTKVILKSVGVSGILKKARKRYFT
ncbi:hypothetical protein AUJ69_02060 [Candidatus Woesearchaeota archaeon CG1_02_47_18]|nr:MAG: hypothetical protein AUJ69_02060 [Candidatus Woesearchaeota archaeon CG1_02_47_18]